MWDAEQPKMFDVSTEVGESGNLSSGESVRSPAHSLLKKDYRMTPCEAQVTRLHETFECLENRGHFGPHEGETAFGFCEECNGLIVHAEGCSLFGQPIRPPGILRSVRWTGTGSGAVLLTFRP